MEEANFKDRRQELIDRLVEQQESMTGQDSSKAVTALATIAVTLLTIVQQQIGMFLLLLTMIADWIWIGIKLPFSYFYYAFDVTMITCWHGRQIYKKMIGGPTPRRNQ